MSTVTRSFAIAFIVCMRRMWMATEGCYSRWCHNTSDDLEEARR